MVAPDRSRNWHLHQRFYELQCRSFPRLPGASKGCACVRYPDSGTLLAVALKQLDSLGVRASAAPTLLHPTSSLGNASVLLVEQSMSLPDMDVTFAWLSQQTAVKPRCLIWSGFSTGSISRELYTAAGVAAVDTRTAHPFSISAFGRRFNFSSAAPSDAYSGFLEFSVKHPVQRSEWGLAKVVATTDDGGIQVLHRHHSDAGGVFVMSSLSPEQDSGMPSEDLQAWFKGLLSLCGEQY